MTTHDAPATFTARVNLVMVPVVVRDASGRAIGTLHQEDFQLFDKGKPQVILKFSLEKPGTPNITAEPAIDEAGGTPKAGPAAPPIPERFVAYLFDDIHLSVSDLLQSRVAAEKHLAEIEPATRAAIFTTSGRTTLDFTDDRAQLRETLRHIQPWTSAALTSTDCPQVTYYQANLILNMNDDQALNTAVNEAMACIPPQQDQNAARAMAQAMAQAAARNALNVGDQETHVAMTVLQDAVRRITAATGSRSLILVSPGFFLTFDHREEETEIMDRAIRGNVIISALNARGVFNPGLEVDASQSEHVPAAVLSAKSQYQTASALADEDILAELASATGGTFVHNTNDLVGGLKQVAAQPEFIYVLGFSPQNLKFDGRYHTLKVSVKVPRGLGLQARRGYYAPKHDVDPEQEAKEEIREAMFSRDEMRDLPADLNMQFFKSSDYNARLSVVARVDVRHLHFRKAEDRNVDNLTITSGVFDRNGNFLHGTQKVLEMRLRDQTLAGLPESGISVRTTFDLAPGAYMVRLVVRDSEGQVMAARNGTVRIP
ncbi:MAG: VWA domain-containing protein [Acidobacteriia bacterium]|nr:VWA domain-containing protein [Terriglobia bacterium]